MTVPLLTASCGSDEATDNDTPPGTGGSATEPEGGDDGGGLIGGTTGTGGTSTSGGRASGGSKSNAGAGGTTGGSNTAGKGGGGTTGGTPATPGASLGTDCVSDASCGDLGCLLPEETGVPHGLCTANCLEDADCPDGGVCLSDGIEEGICLEGCTPGPVGIGELKCHDRPDMTCTYLYLPTGEACTVDADCPGADELCDTEGECRSPSTACFPQCGNNGDCPTGMFCDPDGGACVEEEPTGDPDGVACDPEAAEETCLGRCITFVDDMGEPVESVCATDCTFLSPGACGWEDPDAPAPAFCYSGDGDVGDQGLCYPLCDCDADCAGDRLCYEFPEDPAGFEEVFGHRSLCLPPDDTVESIPTCP
jgi:hypothetical protein